MNRGLVTALCVLGVGWTLASVGALLDAPAISIRPLAGLALGLMMLGACGGLWLERPRLTFDPASSTWGPMPEHIKVVQLATEQIGLASATPTLEEPEPVVIAMASETPPEGWSEPLETLVEPAQSNLATEIVATRRPGES